MVTGLDTWVRNSPAYGHQRTYPQYENHEGFVGVFAAGACKRQLFQPIIFLIRQYDDFGKRAHQQVFIHLWRAYLELGINQYSAV